MKTFNDYKYIITSGCSYSQISKAIIDIRQGSVYKKFNIPNFKKWNGHSNIIIIDVGLSSHGSDWQSDSTIHTITKLLELGIESKNIYCFVEWSEWHRISANTNYFIKSDFNDLSWFKYTGTYGNLGIIDIDVDRQEVVYNSFHNIADGLHEDPTKEYRNLDNYSEVAWHIEDKLDIRQCKDLPQLARIGDMVYISPSHIHNDLKGKNPEFDMWFEKALEEEKSLSQDLKMKRYLDNILRTQWFLKSNNISYNFVHMNSQFSNWGWDTVGTKRECFNQTLEYNNDIDIDKEKLLPISEKTDIEHFWPNHKQIFEKIDLSNWWFYESDTFRRGGIDEFVLDTFGKSIYTSMNGMAHDSDDEVKLSINVEQPRFGFHPTLISYLFLWNLACTNCSFFSIDTEYEAITKQRIIDDINSDKLTEWGICISHKWANKLYKERTNHEENDILYIKQLK